MVDVVTFDADDVERYADTLVATVSAVATSGVAAGAGALRPIAGQIWMGRLTTASNPGEVAATRRPRVRDENLRAQVFVRDRFRCTACGARAVPRSILVALHDLFPEAIGYDVHYARGKMHPVFWALAPEADHIHPHARGGSNTLDNLTTLHAACNTMKADSFTADRVIPPASAAGDGWDGLLSYYPALIAAGAGEVRPRYHREWARRYATLTAEP